MADENSIVIDNISIDITTNVGTEVISRLQILAESLQSIKNAQSGSFSGIKNLAENLKSLNTAINEIDVDKLETKAQKIQAILSSLNSAIKNTATSTQTPTVPQNGTVGVPTEGSESVVNEPNTEVAESIKDVGESATSTSSELEKVNETTNTTNSVFSKLKPICQTTGSVFKKFGSGAVSALGKGGKIATSALGKVGSGALSLGKKMGSGLLSPVKKVGSGVVGLAKKFKALFVMRILRTIVKAFIQDLGQGVQNLYQFSKASGTSFSSAMDKISSATQNIGNAFAVSVAPILEKVAPLFEAVADKVLYLGNIISKTSALINGKATYTKAIKSTKEYAKANSNLTTSIDELNVLSSETGDTSSMFTEASVTDALGGNLVANLKKSIVSGDWKGLGSTLAEKFNGLVTKIKNLHIGKKIANTLNNLSDFLAGVIEDINWDELGVTFGEFINDLLDIDLEQVIENLGNFTSGIFDGINAAIKKIDFEKLGKKLKGVLKKAFVKTGELLPKVLETALNLGVALLDLIIGLDTDDASDESSKKIKEVWSDAWEKAWPSICDLWNKLAVRLAYQAILPNIKLLDGIFGTNYEEELKYYFGISDTMPDSMYTEKENTKKANYLIELNDDKKLDNDVKKALKEIIKLSANGKYDANSVLRISKSKYNKLDNYTKNYISNLKTDGLTVDLYKNGGFPSQGDFFVANESGAELVGTINGKTAVASNNEITGISSTIESTTAQQNQLLREQNRLLQNIYEKSGVTLDGRQLLTSTQKAQRNRGVQIGGGLAFG